MNALLLALPLPLLLQLLLPLLTLVTCVISLLALLAKISKTVPVAATSMVARHFGESLYLSNVNLPRGRPVAVDAI
jgi:hypothetical protein